MSTLRIGTVEFLNTAPLCTGLGSVQTVELVRAVPSRLIGLLLDDRVDLALVSLIDIARSPVPLAVLPVGMIGCDGPTLTVRLFSDRPIDQIEQIHADTDSHTSVALARLLLKRLHGSEPEFIEFDARERVATGGAAGAPGGSLGDWPPAVLLIGDKVVSDCPPAVRYPHQLDLGDAWRSLTGLPFVYAVWACLADRADDPRIMGGAVLLDRTRRRNTLRSDRIAADSAGAHGWPDDLARRYIGRLLRYEFGAREQEAAGIFLRMAAEEGLAPETELRIETIGDFVQTPG